MKVGLLQLSSGIAGDMFLGALLDAGASLEAMRKAVGAVSEGRLDLSSEETMRGGMRGTRVTVLWDGKPVEEPGGPAPEPSGTTPHAVHEHSHSHAHAPGPRDFAGIETRVAAAPLAAGVRERAHEVFRRLAEVEGHIHGVAPESVHFHELGTWDALADVVGTVAGLASLGLDRLYHGTVAVGGGRVAAAHGWLPVPAPATLALLAGRSCRFEEEAGELTTPTGAALVAVLAEPVPPRLVLLPERTGYGAGSQDPPHRPNLARLVVGRDEIDPPRRTSLAVIEAALDDSTPEEGGDLIQRLLEEGALDVTLTPLVMKKGRPGFLVRVLAPPDGAEEMASRLLRLSSTLGARWRLEERLELDRRIDLVRLDGTEVRVKVAVLPDGTERPHVEFEDLAALARERNCSLADVRRDVELVWRTER